MKFLKSNYKAYSVKWIAQRIIAVFKERRLPQLGNSSNLKSIITNGLNRFKQFPSYTPETDNNHYQISMMEVKIPEAQKQANLINSYFDCIYLLNLKHRTDKRLKSIWLLKQLGIDAKIVDAVNGHLSPFKEQYERFSRIPPGVKNTHPLEKTNNRKMISGPGAWGVLKSKKIIFQDAIKNNYKRVLILQDDMFFIEDFHRRFASFIKDIDDDWKIIALGATQHSWTVPGSIYYKDPDIHEYDPTQPFYFPLRTDGAFALGYDHSVFQFIIDEIDKMNCSFDSGAVRAVYELHRGKCFVCQPNLIIADVSTSDIRGGRDQEHFSAKMKWDLKLYDRDKHDELVSIIMPAYNAEKTIEKSICSVLSQTYENFELIIVDDGSTDKTETIIKNIAAQDKRIIFQRNDQNRGCYFVRNDALRLSKGRYIAIQDADDISLKNRIEKQLIPLVSGNAFASFCLFLRSRCSVEELDLSDQEGMMELVHSRRIKENGIYQYQDKPNLALATSVYKRELFEKYGLFWESRFGSDGEFLERIFYHELGKTFNAKTGNAHTFISQTGAWPDAFILLDELLYISPEMKETNLSMKYEINGQLRKQFIQNYRNRLSGKSEDQYPGF